MSPIFICDIHVHIHTFIQLIPISHQQFFLEVPRGKSTAKWPLAFRQKKMKKWRLWTDNQKETGCCLQPQEHRSRSFFTGRMFLADTWISALQQLQLNSDWTLDPQKLRDKEKYVLFYDAKFVALLCSDTP